MRFCRVTKPALSWTPSILQLIFFHFGGYKIWFLPRREPQGSRLPSIVWANFSHFGILKMWFLTIRETTISWYLAMIANFLNFWGLKMPFAQSRFKGTKFRECEFSMFPHLPHFGSLKMRFLPIRETNVSRYLAKSGNFLNFWGLKKRFALSWNPCCKDTKLRVIKFSACIKLRVKKFSAF